MTASAQPEADGIGAAFGMLRAAVRVFQPRIPQAIAALGVLLVAAGFTIAEHMLEHERTLAVTAAEKDASSLARAYEEYVYQVVRRLDHALSHLRDEYEHDPREFSFRAGWHSPLHADLAFQIVVTDAEGRLVLSSLASEAPVMDFSDRAYFQAHRDDGEDRLYISTPLVGRVSGQTTIQFTRRLRRPDGAFNGVMILSVSPDKLAGYYGRAEVGLTGSVMLVGFDRVVRARQAVMPAPTPVVGSVHPDRPFFNPAQPQGVFHSVSAIDGVARIVAYRRLKEQPLIALVALGEAEAMAAFVERSAAVRQAEALVSAVVLAAVFAVAWLAQRQARQQAWLVAAQAQLARTEERRTAELQRSNAELEAFAYAASHDLRQPLRTINSYLALLEQDLADRLDDETREYMAFARTGAQRMDRLIVDLLEYSRVGRRSRPFAAHPAADIIDGAVGNLEAAIGEAQATVAVAGDLPAIWGDAGELTRLFQNLIGNAVKYRAADRAPLVRIDCRAKGAEWHFTVQDNGIGIAPGDFERVFGIFQRLHGRDAYEGTGVGLAVCKKIVEHHGGRIWITSEPGEGSVFHVALPRHEEQGA
ncbi:sensor histidine kinase [Azospirillum sp. TSO22-1]|uniref:sensor histidine kinase n=1 Tax=Azospirillum sp. TSO22-1 TaxID=716789 RepID=UPI0018EEACED|nr:sensor histidine kinase [Azospirillum sp. TSO22-1]